MNMTFDIRLEEPADRIAVREVITAAFGSDIPDHGADVAMIWDSLGDHRRAGLVAELRGRVVGHVGLSRGWIDARRELVDVWVLSPLSVDPEQQRRGIGTALVAAAIDTARLSGTPALFLEGSPTYYGPRGFEAAVPRGFRPAALERTPHAAFQVVAFDGLQPWMTGQLIYPSVWWEHGAVGLRDPMLADLEQRFITPT
jgi:putative acetyltransferase